MAIFRGYVSTHVLMALQLTQQLKPQSFQHLISKKRNGNNARLPAGTTEFPMLGKHLIGICLKYNEPP